jgi:hypothetical protein
MLETLLQNRDYTIVIAKTVPTQTPMPPGHERRWENARQAILELTQQCEQLDPDGITLYLSQQDDAEHFEVHRSVLSKQLSTLFAGHFPPEHLELAPALRSVFADYFDRRAKQATKANGELVLVLIDGEPKDRMAIARLIINATAQLDRPDELGIGLIQIGEDIIARGFLSALDDNLKAAGAKFDIVKLQVLAEVATHSLTEFLMEVLGTPVTATHS